MGLETPKGAGAAIAAARARIAPFVHVTPVMTSRRLDGITGAELFFKCENFQRAGAFKARGAFNAVMSLTDAEAAAGVYTHSSGNHGAALALAAQTRGIPCHVVMPANAADVKKAAVLAYGGEIHFCEPTLAAREETAERVGAETGARFVHPYDDEAVIAGQGTAAVELIEAVARAGHPHRPDRRRGTDLGDGAGGAGAGFEAAGDRRRAGRRGRRRPLVRRRGHHPAGQLGDHRRRPAGVTQQADVRSDQPARRRQVLTASEYAIVDAMRLIWSAMKIVVEPSAAVPLAAILEHPDAFAGRRVGVILTGGNVDLDALPWMRGA